MDLLELIWPASSHWYEKGMFLVFVITSFVWILWLIWVVMIIPSIAYITDRYIVDLRNKWPVFRCKYNNITIEAKFPHSARLNFSYRKNQYGECKVIFTGHDYADELMSATLGGLMVIMVGTGAWIVCLPVLSYYLLLRMIRALVRTNKRVSKLSEEKCDGLDR